MKLVKLSRLPIGKEGVIKNIIYKKNVSKRLQELGFIKGNKVKMLMISPKEKTFIIALYDYVITFRKNATDLIEVEYD